MSIGTTASKILCLFLIISTYGAFRIDSPKPVIRSFLSNWLIRKDVDGIRSAFAKNAFTNKLILSDGCIGHITDIDRTDAKTVEDMVIGFLKHVSLTAEGKSLKEILKLKKLVNENMLKGERLTSAKRDGYVLVQTADLAFLDENQKYFESTFPAKSYALLFLLVRVMEKGVSSDLPLYLIWAHQNGSWKIIHAGMQCL